MARIDKVKYDDIYTHKRGWGEEIWIENCEEYCGKILIIEPEKRGSLHFHMNKKETMFLQKGKITLSLIDKDDGKKYEVDLEEGDKILIEPGQVHQIINKTNKEAYLYEFSTKHEESDSYRIVKGD